MVKGYAVPKKKIKKLDKRKQEDYIYFVIQSTLKLFEMIAKKRRQ
jgi:hypothetical protein